MLIWMFVALVVWKSGMALAMGDSPSLSACLVTMPLLFGAMIVQNHAMIAGSALDQKFGSAIGGAIVALLSPVLLWLIVQGFSPGFAESISGAFGRYSEFEDKRDLAIFWVIGSAPLLLRAAYVSVSAYASITRI